MRALLWLCAAILLSPMLIISARARRLSVQKKILIIQLGKIGDLVATTPMFRAAKESDASSRIDVLCLRTSSAAIEHNPFVSRIHSIDSASRITLLKTLRAERYDAVVTCLPGMFPSLIGLFISAPIRIVTSSDAHGIFVRIASLFATHRKTYQIRTSTFAHYMALLQPLNITPISYQLDYIIPESIRQKVDQWLSTHTIESKAFICMNVSAGNGVKEWPIEKWSALCDDAIAKHEMPVALSSLDTQLMRTIRSRSIHQDRIVCAEDFSLDESAALYRASRLFVSADTGPMYIAYAVGASIVIMLGPIHPAEQVPPESARVIHVPPPHGCEPWVFVSRTPRTGTAEQLRCARDTSVDSVARAIATFLTR